MNLFCSNITCDDFLYHISFPPTREDVLIILKFDITASKRFKKILSVAQSKDQSVKTVFNLLASLFVSSYAQHAFHSSVVTMLVYKNLLCIVGGEEWKAVAERLGLSPREIRFLDNRTLNPFDAALAFIARQRNITVADLYELLNECDCPMIADLL